jgi:hypothetical protein
MRAVAIWRREMGLDRSGRRGGAATVRTMNTFGYSYSPVTEEFISKLVRSCDPGQLSVLQNVETLWHVITDSAVKPPQPGQPPQLIKLSRAHATMTTADTFQQVRS